MKLRIALVRVYSPIIQQTVPPLNLALLAACLRKAGFSDLHIVDAQTSPGRKLTADRVLALKPDLVGITAMAVHADAAHDLANRIKSSNPEICTMIGGPYPTMSPERAISDPAMDFAVCGEGEDVITWIAELISNQNSSNALNFNFQPDSEPPPGLYWHEEKSCKTVESRNTSLIQNTGKAIPVSDMDSLPDPAWDLIDMENIYDHVSSPNVRIHRRFLPVFSSRGCPYRCLFCHRMFGTDFRARSASVLVEEIKRGMQITGARDIHVLDDAFSVDRDRVLEFCSRISALPESVGLKFFVGVRADSMDDEILDAMARAGTYSTCYGIETGSPRVSKLIRKDLDIDDVRRAVEGSRRRGIFTYGYFMLGFPGETEEEMLMTVDLACSLPLHMANFFTVVPFEGTDLHRMAVKMGKVPPDDQNLYSFSRPFINLSEVSDQRFREIHGMAYRRFYMDPRRIITNILALPGKRRLAGKMIRWTAEKYLKP